jgi:hypothetical protein
MGDGAPSAGVIPARASFPSGSLLRVGKNALFSTLRRLLGSMPEVADLLKKSREKWEWTREADAALQKVKCAFTEATILQHFDAEEPITFQTDTSGFAIAGILHQFDGFGVLTLTSFYSRKCSPAEPN